MSKRQRTVNPVAAQIANSAAKTSPPTNPLTDPPVRMYLPTGCAVLNCVLSDNVHGGWPCGRIVNPIGDSDTCKTVLAMGALAEAAGLKEFANHRLVYLDEEASVTCQPLFGSRLERVEILRPSAEDPKLQAPETIEELHYFLLDLLDDGPFVCVVDSFDALPSQQELEETKKNKKAFRKGEESSGSYGMAKQKYNKKMMREIKGRITETDSLLIIVSQTIANIGSQFDPKTVAGGNALEFFSRLRLWLSRLGTDKVNGVNVGRKLKCKVSKNHITGKKRECNLWVYERYGIMDVMSTLEWLCENGTLPKLGGWVEVPQWGVKKQMKDLVKFVLANNVTDALNLMLQEAWEKKESTLDMGWGCKYE